jgi:CheY-like chemotaxis protein
VDLPPVKANELRLVEVFTQLLITAARAIAPGSCQDNEIRVSSRLEPDGRACVWITSSGPDLRTEQLERAFDPLWSVSGPGEVTGLGFSLCQRIIGAFNGELLLTTGAATSTFTIYLPQDSAEANAPDEASERPVRSLRLLIVDDEVTILRSLTRLLSDEHQVVTCSSSAEALELLQTDRNFDIILCDLMMPHVTGMELHRSLKQQGAGLEQRMVFMTAGEFATPMQSFLSSVPNERIAKPLNLTVLRKLLARVAATDRMSAPPTLH